MQYVLLYTVFIMIIIIVHVESQSVWSIIQMREIKSKENSYQQFLSL